ncbi:MAG: glycosyltransferase [Candidatus Eisenbacteria bacterium]|nr:glycosyltransferase [Candidatus Eisenbacteria bacterium]
MAGGGSVKQDGPELTYVLVTAAHNEEQFIAMTLDSVVQQSVLPLRWVIVSDASTDQTDAIVKEYAGRYDWIRYVRIAQATPRDFAGKARAFGEGYERVKGLEFDFVGNLDADVSLEPDYYEFLLGKAQERPGHGLLGTTYVDEHRESFDPRVSDPRHVPGACQLFRRECFEEIGGYRPVPGGGVDLLAELMCRKAGWRTEAFMTKTFRHHRPSGTAARGMCAARFNQGYRDYDFGSDLLWMVLKAANFMRKRPYVAGGLCLFAGYLRGMMRRAESGIPSEIRSFRRAEQRDRLKAFFRSTKGDAQ